MNRWIVFFVVLAALLLPTAGRAQDEIRLSSLEVDLWPEFDRAEMLVIYQATLAPETTFPAAITLRIPAAASKPHVVAVGSTPATVVDSGIEYTTRSEGDWIYIQITMEAPVLQLEYYDPSLDLQSSPRTFVYQWPGDYAVGEMTVVAQQPAGASNLTISPAASGNRVDSFGLVTQAHNAGALQAGETLAVTISYQKTSNTLSVMNLPVEASGAIPESTLARYLPWALVGILGLALVAGAAVWYWQTGRQAAAPSSSRKRHRTAAPRASEPGNEPAGGAYCHQCGKRAAAGDRFCRTCGATLRIE